MTIRLSDLAFRRAPQLTELREADGVLKLFFEADEGSCRVVFDTHVAVLKADELDGYHELERSFEIPRFGPRRFAVSTRNSEFFKLFVSLPWRATDSSRLNCYIFMAENDYVEVISWTPPSMFMNFK